jgi:hypothetical protein
LRKLEQLAVSSRLDDLRVPPGNRLEALAGDRAGQHSIRINDQWRVCFVWSDGAAHNVEIVDYGKRAITADTDLRLCRFFGLSDGWWLALQSRHDIEVARDAMAADLKRIHRFEPAAA